MNPGPAVLAAALLVLHNSASAAAEVKEEIGSLAGAQFRILMPGEWNGALVLWSGGYTPSPVTFRPGANPGKFTSALLDRGYAVAESGYSRGGVAVNEAVKESDALRQYFRRKHPKTNAVYAAGESMGGLVALALVESFPNSYRAGASFCGMLGSPYQYIRKAFDMLTVFNYFHPDTLPAPNDIPPTFRATEEAIRKTTRALAANAEIVALLGHAAGTTSAEELGAILTFHTDLLRDVNDKCGGNPIDNMGTVYAAGPDSVTVNAGVRRTHAAAPAAACLKKMTGPRGTLVRPFLAVDAAADPVVPASFVNDFLASLAGTAAEAWFVRQYVAATGHCSVPAEARLSAFDDLAKWSDNRMSRPKPGPRAR